MPDTREPTTPILQEEARTLQRLRWMALIALAVFVLAIPFYAVRESQRMTSAQHDLRQEYIADASLIYLDNCASCHGAGGEGIGIVPPLHNPNLAEAEHDFLYRTISNPPHGTAMAIWHLDEGDNINPYKVEELITLIRYADWAEVASLAESLDRTPVTHLPQSLEQVALDSSQMDDPHQCVSCHEEPAIHANRFGMSCARCHSLSAWKPALLNYHTFALDHGSKTQLACQACHTISYATYDCYACHDHTPEDMAQVHLAEGITTYEQCIACHPTGAAGEGEQYWSQPAGQSGQSTPLGAALP